jgi:chromosome segregation ATPase
MNTTNNCSESKRELIPGMDMLIDHMKKQSQEIERLREENKQLKEQLNESPEEGTWIYNEHHENVIESLEQEIQKLKESNEFIRKTCLMADEENKQLNDEIQKLKQQKATDFWENHELRKELNRLSNTTMERELRQEESSASEAEEKKQLDWICYEFVRYDYDPEDGTVYDTEGTKIAEWDDQGDGKMVWVDKKYKKKHNRLAKKSMADLVAMATAPVN